MEKIRNAYRILTGNLKGKGHEECLGVCGKLMDLTEVG
jgi:hypothetical protein